MQIERYEIQSLLTRYLEELNGKASLESLKAFKSLLKQDVETEVTLKTEEFKLHLKKSEHSFRLSIQDKSGEMTCRSKDLDLFIQARRSSTSSTGIYQIAANYIAKEKLATFDKFILNWDKALSVAVRHESGKLSGWLIENKEGKAKHFLEHREMLNLVEDHSPVEIKPGIWALKEKSKISQKSA